MCGIVALVAEPGTEPLLASRLVGTALTAMQHRGPDGRALVEAGAVHLGVNRLAVVGGPEGDQPLWCSDGSVVLVGNGELYGGAAGSTSMPAATGSRRRSSTSDLAPAVEMAATDERTLADLRGMYALAAARIESETAPTHLVVARDRVGMKPLRWADTDQGFVVASESKALLAAGLVEPNLEDRQLLDVMCLGHPVGSVTPFVGIDSVPPGAVWAVGPAAQNAEIERRVMSEPRADWIDDDVDAQGSEAEATDLADHVSALGALMDDAVATHLVADAPPGVLLSGGLDSGVLACLGAAHGGMGPAFSVAEDPEGPDVLRAMALARRLGLDHRIVLIDFESWLGALPRHLWATEQWHSATGVAASILYRQAAQEVRASGER